MADKGAILNAFENAGSNITHAAEYLGISRGTLYRLMEKYAIHWPGKAVEHALETKSDDDDKEQCAY
jgi:DNA-binding NtrC family response regulator